MRTKPALAITSALLLGSLAVTSSSAAAGQAPKGKAHQPFTSDHHISDFTCDDPTLTDVLVTPAGPYSTWRLDGTDQHYVMASVTGELTVTFPDASEETYDWRQSFGMKTGKASGAVSCTATFSHEHDGVREEGPITIVLIPVW